MKHGEENSLQISKGDESPKEDITPHNEVQLTHKEEYSGPIPTPKMFAEFEKVLPGSANRILTMAEDQSKHRHKMESRVIWLDGGQSILGLILAFIVVVLALLLGTYLIMNNKPVSGLATILVALGTVVGTMIYRQKQKNKTPDNPKRL